MKPSSEVLLTLQDKANRVLELLVEMHGEPPFVPRREPLHELISTMLSHRTTEANEAKAFAQMWERFGSWETIRDAPQIELIEAIAPSNFAGAKAPNIQRVLERIIEERGEANIDFLRDLSPEDAMKWLTSLPGVGVKTATLVLLFCFHKPVLPVDTHLHRVSIRLGLLPDGASAEKAHDVLLSLLPHDAKTLYTFHITMLRHGQKICVWRKPLCEKCALRPICDWYQTHRKPEERVLEANDNIP
jgi:endonuclease-3